MITKGRLVSVQYAPGREPRAGFGASTPEGPKPEKRQIKFQFNIKDKPPSSWDELHRRALAHTGGEDWAWLLEFTVRISGNCDCRRHWKELLNRTPPDFSNYFAWTVAAHNDVNRRLGKPEVSVSEAMKIWGPPDVDTPPNLNPPL